MSITVTGQVAARAAVLSLAAWIAAFPAFAADARPEGRPALSARASRLRLRVWRTWRAERVMSAAREAECLSRVMVELDATSVQVRAHEGALSRAERERDARRVRAERAVLRSFEQRVDDLSALAASCDPALASVTTSSVTTIWVGSPNRR